MGKKLIYTLLEKYKNYRITLECENYLVKYYQRFGFRHYKTLHSNNIHWNILYIDNKCNINYNSIYNELYNNKYDKYCYVFCISIYNKNYCKITLYKVIYLQNYIFYNL